MRNDGTVFVSEWESKSPGQNRWDRAALPHKGKSAMILYASTAPDRSEESLRAGASLPEEEVEDEVPPQEPARRMTPQLAQGTGKRTWARIGRPASLTKGQQMWMDRIAKKILQGPKFLWNNSLSYGMRS